MQYFVGLVIEKVDEFQQEMCVFNLQVYGWRSKVGSIIYDGAILNDILMCLLDKIKVFSYEKY